MNQQEQRPIEDFTIQELEKLELQLWRAKDQYEANLKGVINDLNIITARIAELNKLNSAADTEDVVK